MNDSKEILFNLDRYFNLNNIPLEDDVVSKKLIERYYEEKELVKHWSQLIDKSEVTIVPQKKTEKKINSFRNKQLFGIFATLAASLAILVIFPFKSQDPIDKLLAKHYEIPYNRNILKGPALIDLQRNTAYSLYREKKYEAAIHFFLKEIPSTDFQDSDHFFIGLSYLYTDQPEKAIDHLKQVADKTSSLYKDSAIWYTGLALVDAQRLTEASRYLEKVALWNGNKGKQNLALEAKLLLDIISVRKE